MKKAVAVLAACFAMLPSLAHAAATFEFLFDEANPLSVSSDGSVLAGTMNDGHFTAFRWTQATGVVSLGRPQAPGGGSGGSPGISANGTRVA